MASAHSRRLLTISIAAAMLLSLLLAAGLIRAHRTLTRVAEQAADARHLSYSFGPLLPVQNPGFEPIAAPSAFISAAALDGHIFLAGPGELQMYTASGASERTYRVGLDLPAAPLGPTITARLRGQVEAQLFVATAGAGVLVFDPASRTFAHLLPSLAAFRDVTALAALSSGELLIGTRRSGLLVFDGKFLAFYRPEYTGASITSLLTQGNEVWAATQDHGIFHTHAGVTDRFESELPDPHVEALAGQGTRVFAATPVGVQMFEDGRPSRVLAPDYFARALFADSKALTISSLTDGTASIPFESGTLRSGSSTIADGQPVEQFVSFPGSGDLYAVRHDGLFRRSGKRWVPILEAPKASVTDSNIAALDFSPDGRLWIGYFDRGLDLVDLAAGSTQHVEDDHLFCINRIALDPRRQTMAVATANGLVLFDSAARPRQVLTRRDGLISDHITDVVFSPAASSAARMTLATPAGLTFVDDTGVSSLYAFQGLVNNHVYALASASSDEILAGTLGGVSMLSQQSVRRNFTVANSGLRHNWITAALPMAVGGKDAGYMVGTYGAGVMRLDGTGHFAPMDFATRNMVINPNAMLATGTHVFAGSLNQGLWSYSLATQHWTQITAGLPSLNVTAFAAHDGMLYVGTQNGLVRIAESKLPQ